mgnify:CR=1 FL=1
MIFYTAFLFFYLLVQFFEVFFNVKHSQKLLQMITTTPLINDKKTQNATL